MKKITRHIVFCASVLLGSVFATTAFANESNAIDSDAFLITSGDPLDPMYANAGDNLRSGVGSIFVEFEGTSPFGFGPVSDQASEDERDYITFPEPSERAPASRARERKVA